MTRRPLRTAGDHGLGLGQEVEQQRGDLVGGLELHPVADAVDALVPPRPVDVPLASRSCPTRRGRSRPMLHTPIVGACTCGNSSGGSIHVRGWTLARYQLSAAVSAPGRARSSATWSMSGWCAHSRKLAQSSADSHCSAMPSNWNSSMYHDFCALHESGVAERRRVTDRQRDEVVDAVGDERRHRPRQGRTPVVTDDVGAFDAERVEDADDVAGDVENAVALDLDRLRRLAEAAQVGGDHAEPGVEQRRHLVAPQRVRVGEAVEQQHGRSLAFVLHRKREIAERDGLHGRTFHAPTRRADRPDPGRGAASGPPERRPVPATPGRESTSTPRSSSDADLQEAAQQIRAAHDRVRQRLARGANAGRRSRTGVPRSWLRSRPGGDGRTRACRRTAARPFGW